MSYVYKNESGQIRFKANGILLSIMIRNYPDIQAEVNKYLKNDEFSIEDKMEFIRMMGASVDQYCGLPEFIGLEKEKESQQVEKVSSKDYFNKIIYKLDSILSGKAGKL